MPFFWLFARIRGQIESVLVICGQVFLGMGGQKEWMEGRMSPAVA
jgi:hypothetical protein